ncbi:CPBP family glutamic-type intramembrane protease [Algibacter sp. 2305UL17-15]|uniref:CPBP family glutamic-type intramembrane protease n=1 Tax=Algibacter sp. 2305UL17-15 TaxID=3231268 RepID=UPI003459A088
MTALKYKYLEFFTIFITIPVSFCLDYAPLLKLGIGFLGFIYVVYILLKVEQEKFKIASNLNWKLFWKTTVAKFLVIAIVSIIFVWITNRDALFYVLLDKPLKWAVLLFVYSVFSVYPQELIYRTFFFKRYGNIFKIKHLLIFVNAILFALAHLFFKQTLVLIIAFIGGIIFAITYQNTKSTLLVSIEHAIYGCWLFTVGMGEMLGFPS